MFPDSKNNLNPQFITIDFFIFRILSTCPCGPYSCVLEFSLGQVVCGTIMKALIGISRPKDMLVVGGIFLLAVVFALTSVVTGRLKSSPDHPLFDHK